MTKASIDLQDLRRRIYVKAKAEPTWRFWGLYVHVCKKETLRAAYEMAKQNVRWTIASATRLIASCAVRLGRYPNDPAW
jgi:hypothetical protein